MKETSKVAYETLQSFLTKIIINNSLHYVVIIIKINLKYNNQYFKEEYFSLLHSNLIFIIKNCIYLWNVIFLFII